MHRFILTLAVSALIAVGCDSAIAANAPARVQQVRVTVTGNGFEPAKVQVKAGQPVRLVITRKTDRTCATSVVLRQFGIQKPLPLGQPVEVRFTPKRPGTIRYACAMDMVAGEIVVR